MAGLGAEGCRRRVVQMNPRDEIPLRRRHGESDEGLRGAAVLSGCDPSLIPGRWRTGSRVSSRTPRYWTGCDGPLSGAVQRRVRTRERLAHRSGGRRPLLPEQGADALAQRSEWLSAYAAALGRASLFTSRDSAFAGSRGSMEESPDASGPEIVGNTRPPGGSSDTRHLVPSTLRADAPPILVTGDGHREGAGRPVPPSLLVQARARPLPVLQLRRNPR
jgi:hypothetical protein